MITNEAIRWDWLVCSAARMWVHEDTVNIRLATRTLVALGFYRLDSLNSLSATGRAHLSFKSNLHLPRTPLTWPWFLPDLIVCLTALTPGGCTTLATIQGLRFGSSLGSAGAVLVEN